MRSRWTCQQESRCYQADPASAQSSIIAVSARELSLCFPYALSVQQSFGHEQLGNDTHTTIPVDSQVSIWMSIKSWHLWWPGSDPWAMRGTWRLRVLQNHWRLRSRWRAEKECGQPFEGARKIGNIGHVGVWELVEYNAHCFNPHRMAFLLARVLEEPRWNPTKFMQCKKKL